MPLRIDVNDLRPGMRLARPLIHEGRTMLRPNHTLSEKEIEHLRKRFPRQMMVVRDPHDRSISFFVDKTETPQQTEATRTLLEMVKKVQSQLSNMLSMGRVHKTRTEQAVNHCIQYIGDQDQTARLICDHLKSDSPLAQHAVITFYLSMALGSQARTYVAEERRRMTVANQLSDETAHDLSALGLGILLSDITLYDKPHLFDPDHKLNTKDKLDLLLHPHQALDLIPRDLPMLAKTVVKTHHENMAGMGFPERIPSEKLHVFSRIARIVDSFTAMTDPDLFGGKVESPIKVLWNMSQGPWRFYFDQTLMRHFLKIVHPLPVGSQIEMCDSTYGVVVGYNTRHPLFPKVIRALDHEKKRLSQTELKGPFYLNDSRQIRAKSVQGVELSFLYDQSTPSNYMAKPCQKITSARDIFFP